MSHMPVDAIAGSSDSPGGSSDSPGGSSDSMVADSIAGSLDSIVPESIISDSMADSINGSDSTAGSSDSTAILDRFVENLDSEDLDVRKRAIPFLFLKIMQGKVDKIDFLKRNLVQRVVAKLVRDTEALRIDDPIDADPNSAKSSVSQAKMSAAILGKLAVDFDAGLEEIHSFGGFAVIYNFLQWLLRDQSKYVEVITYVCRSLESIFPRTSIFPRDFDIDFSAQNFVAGLITLLDCPMDIVVRTSLSLISRCCVKSSDGVTLSEAGIVDKLVNFLEFQKYPRKEVVASLAAILKNNSAAVGRFLGYQSTTWRPWRIAVALDMQYPDTKLMDLICWCSIDVRESASPAFPQNVKFWQGLKAKFLHFLEHSPHGPTRPFTEEAIKKLAFEADSAQHLRSRLKNSRLPELTEKILLEMAEWSKLESCCDTSELESISKSLIHWRHGEKVVACSVCEYNVGSALKAVANFGSKEMIFPTSGVQFEKIRGLILLSKTKVSTEALCKLGSYLQAADRMLKDKVFAELTASTLASFISAKDETIQVPALRLARVIVSGCIESVEYAFAEDQCILKAIGEQIRDSQSLGVRLHGMFVLRYVASGNAYQQEAVLDLLLQLNLAAMLSRYTDNQLRVAILSTLVNVCNVDFEAGDRLGKLMKAGVMSVVQYMVDDPCPVVNCQAAWMFKKSVKILGFP